MSQEPDNVEELDDLDEVGQIEAEDLPPEVKLPADEELDDPNYDESLAEIDPETRGHE